MKRETTVVVPKGTVCQFCGHVYMNPCHGQKKDCQNAVAKRAKTKGKK